MLLMILFLGACAMLGTQEKQRKSAVDDFMYALRWQLHQEAAAFFTSEHRGTFLDQMEGLKDLNVTDVRLQRMDTAADGRSIATRLEMDYYLLPSATLKTLQIDLVWASFESGDAAGKGFLITTPFPRIP
jgi:hypothetical protein